MPIVRFGYFLRGTVAGRPAGWITARDGRVGRCAGTLPTDLEANVPESTDRPRTVTVTDVFYQGGPMGGQHRRFTDAEPESSVDLHGGTYRLEEDRHGRKVYNWSPDPDRRVVVPTDGDEASRAMGDGAGAVLADVTAGVRTDGPSMSPALAVDGDGSSKPSKAEQRDAAKVGSERPATAPRAAGSSASRSGGTKASPNVQEKPAK